MTDKPPADEMPPAGDTLAVQAIAEEPGGQAAPDPAAESPAPASADGPAPAGAPCPAGDPATLAAAPEPDGTAAAAQLDDDAAEGEPDGATAVAEQGVPAEAAEPAGRTMVDDPAARTTADPVPARPGTREPRPGGYGLEAMEPSRRLGDRYRLDERIGAGGMGVVWRATDLMLARGVAVKLLRPEYTQDEDGRARFRAEARHAGSLSHPAIAQVYDYSEDDPAGQPYLVMELVNGPSLAWLLKEGPLDCALAMRIIGQAARGLQAAHATGLVHRDIKPGNLLVSPGWQVKITDFGIARLAGEAPVTRTGAMICTPAYLAPERAAGAPATPAADLYSLGIVAYECLTGRVPFTGEPIAIALAHQERRLPPLPPTVPPPVAALVAALTAKTPEARPGSAGEVATRALQLHAALSGPASGRNFGTATSTPPPLPPAPRYGTPPGGRPGGTAPGKRGRRRLLRTPGTLPTRAAVGLAAVAFVGAAGVVVANLPKAQPQHPAGPVPTAGQSSAAGPATPAPSQAHSPQVISVPHGRRGHHAKHPGKGHTHPAKTPPPTPPSTSPVPSLSPSPSPSDGSPTPTPTPTTPTPTPSPTESAASD